MHSAGWANEARQMGGFGGWVCVCVSYTSLTHTLKTPLCNSARFDVYMLYSPVRLRPPIRTRSSLWPLSRSSSLSRACDSFTTNVFFFVFRKGNNKKTNNNQRRNDSKEWERIGWDRQRLSPSVAFSFLVIIIVITEKKVDQLRISSAHSVGVF